MQFSNYLRTCAKDKNNTEQIVTHTRIGSPEHNIYAGAYSVPPEKKGEFYHKYYEHMFKNGILASNILEHLTEKQITDNTVLPDGRIVNGGILVDFDFRYSSDIVERQHTKEHIDDMVYAYVEEIKNYFTFKSGDNYEIFVCEKPSVNKLPDKTKDGIHMIIGIQADHIIQRLIRKTMLRVMPESVFTDLPLQNEWDAVLDEGITKGPTNWQLYGSCKPNNETYKLRYKYDVKYDATDGEFVVACTDFKAKTAISEALFMKMTAQYEDHPVFPFNPEAKTAYDKCASENKRAHSSSGKLTPSRKRVLIDTITDDDIENMQFTTFESISVNKITNAQQLDHAIDLMLQTFMNSAATCHLPEIHEYTQVLPDMFYKSGSHEMNRKVAFALKDTDNRLFLSWVKLRSKAEDFDYGTIPTLFSDWCKYFNQSGDNRLTKKSIIFWAKQYAFAEYEKIKMGSVSKYIDDTLKYVNKHPEFSIAKVLYQLYKDEFAFIVNGRTEEWYHFYDHRWHLDPLGAVLQTRISEEFMHLYSVREQQYMNELIADGLTMADITTKITSKTDKNETVDITAVEKQAKDRTTHLKKKLASVGMLIQRLQDDVYKKHLMSQARLLFLDREFEKKRDENRYLLGFNNGVFDFKERKFREGRPDDYVTFTTGHDYIALDPQNKPEHAKAMRELNTFMEQVYPDPELRKFMWEHFASTTIGTNPLINQTGLMYLGGGSNAKTKVTDLMKVTLGDYCDEGATALITFARGKADGPAPQILKFKGKRYIMFPEPEKDSVLNDGIYKQLTAEANLNARGLFKAQDLKFNNQAAYVVATNNLMKVKDTTDGTWRRIRIAPHDAKFVDLDKIEAAKLEHKHVFPINPHMDEIIEGWGAYFCSMLIDIALKTNGKTTDCKTVLAASEKYRKEEDIICLFIGEVVQVTDKKSDKIKRNELWNHFKQWYQNLYNMKMTITMAELIDKMNAKHRANTKPNMNYWINMRIKYQNDDAGDEEDGRENGDADL